jgi:hypothetical protein
MSSARPDLRKRSPKKKLIAGLTLMLLLLLVSLLGGRSNQLSPSNAGAGLPLPPTPAAPPGVAALSATPPRSLPRPKPAPAGPARTPAEEILMEIARYGGSATGADHGELPVTESEPPLVALLFPSPEIAGPADYPWPRLSHDSLLLPRRLAGAGGDCPCEGAASPCPENPWPLIADNGATPGETWPPSGTGSGEPWPPLGHDPDAQPVPGEWGRIPGPNTTPSISLPGPGDRGETAPPVPEPATLFLVGTGLACLAGMGRQRKGPA